MQAGRQVGRGTGGRNAFQHSLSASLILSSLFAFKSFDSHNSPMRQVLLASRLCQQENKSYLPRDITWGEVDTSRIGARPAEQPGKGAWPRGQGSGVHSLTLEPRAAVHLLLVTSSGRGVVTLSVQNRVEPPFNCLGGTCPLLASSCSPLGFKCPHVVSSNLVPASSLTATPLRDSSKRP